MVTTALESVSIDGKLRSAWNREQRFVHTRGGAQILFWIVGLFLLSLLVDWFFELPGVARVVLLLANLGVFTWAAWRCWIRQLRRYDATRVALQVEKLHPGLHNLLVSYVQMNGRPRERVHGSPGLIAAMQQRAETAARPLSVQGIVDFMRLKKLLLSSGSVVVLFLISSIFFGDYYAILMIRILNPFTETSYPTRTAIDGVTGDVAVKEGDRLHIEAHAIREAPAQGILFVKHADTGWEPVVLEGGSDGEFIFEQRQATQSFRYYFKLGDAHSKRFDVTVVPPPKILSAHVSVRYPRYTGREAEEFSSLQLPPLPEGSEVSWELRLDQPLESGQMLSREQSPVDVEIDSEDRSIARLTVSGGPMVTLPSGATRAEASTYQFSWTEAKHGFTFADATRHRLELIPDRPPTITIVRPRLRGDQDAIMATKRKVLDLIYEASDDYGLSQAWLDCKVNDRPEVHHHLLGQFPPGTKSDTFQSSWKLLASLPDVKEGDVLTCEITASDNHDGKPNIGRSHSFRLRIVSESEFAQYIEKEKAGGLERTKTALLEETQSDKTIKGLLPAEPNR
jgi:hypothetical protein